MPDFGPFIVSGLAIGAVYALSGLGLVMLYRTTSVINFAYGAVGAVGALTAWELQKNGLAEWLSWIAAILVSTAISTLYGVLIAGRLSGRDQSVNAAATLGVALLMIGFASWRWTDKARSFGLPTDDYGPTILGVRVIATKLVALALALALSWGTSVVLHRTDTGLAMRSLATDRTLSSVLGVSQNRFGALAWAMSGAVGGISGLLLADLVRLEVRTLTFIVVPAAAAALVARLRSLPLVIVAGLGIGLVEACGAAYPSVSNYRGIVPFAMVIALLMWSHRSRSVAIVAKDGR